MIQLFEGWIATDKLLSNGQVSTKHTIHPVDSVIHPSSNRGQAKKNKEKLKGRYDHKILLYGLLYLFIFWSQIARQFIYSIYLKLF